MKKLTMLLTVCLFAGQLMAQTSKTPPPPPPPKPAANSQAMKPLPPPHAKNSGVSTKSKTKKETVKFTPPTIVKDKP